MAQCFWHLLRRFVFLKEDEKKPDEKKPDEEELDEDERKQINKQRLLIVGKVATWSVLAFLVCFTPFALWGGIKMVANFKQSDWLWLGLCIVAFVCFNTGRWLYEKWKFRGMLEPEEIPFEDQEIDGVDYEYEIEIDADLAAAGGTYKEILDIDGENRAYEIKIPKGIQDGSKLRLRGQGQAGVGGGSAGDLFITVRVKPS